MAEMSDHRAKKPESRDIDPASAGTQALVRYDEMCRAIAEAYKIDEVKDIRDKAMAITLYAKQANNHEAELQAIQIRVRAERKAGELLKEIPTAQGQRTDLVPQRDQVAPKHKVLSNLNISKQRAAEWEQLGRDPSGGSQMLPPEDDIPSSPTCEAEIWLVWFSKTFPTKLFSPARRALTVPSGTPGSAAIFVASADSFLLMPSSARVGTSIGATILEAPITPGPISCGHALRAPPRR